MVTNIQTIMKSWHKHDKMNNTYCSGSVLFCLFCLTVNEALILY